MYRCVALFCLENEVILTDESAVIARLPEVIVHFEDALVFLNGRDVTERIKAQDTANGASVVAAFPKVRKALVSKQQEIAQVAISSGKIVISEGRDTGTKVFPDAQIKIYLTASEETRARRRLAQYTEKGIKGDFEAVLEEIRGRDKRDKERAIDPLPSNPEQLGYVILDDSQITEQETLQSIHNELEKRNLV
jgi:cytidylate kinase